MSNLPFLAQRHVAPTPRKQGGAESCAARHLTTRDPRDGFAIARERQGTTVRLMATGELDIATAPRLSDCCTDELLNGAELVVVDLTGVTFIDCSGLNILLAAHRQHPDCLQVIPSPVVARLIDMTGMRHRLPIIELEQQRLRPTG